MNADNRIVNDWSRKELFALPRRKWGESKEYDSVLIISTRRKHDSGWAIMAIIGVNEQKPVEIACECCDDIEWMFPPMKYAGNFAIGQIRTDCCFRSGAIHAWSRYSRFRVGLALSSTEIEVVPIQEVKA